MYTYHTGLTKVMFNKHRLDIVGPFLHPWLLRDKQHSAIGQYPSFYGKSALYKAVLRRARTPHNA